MRKEASLFIIILLFMMGCAAFAPPSTFTHEQKTEYTTLKTLQSAKTFREFGLESAGIFYKKGLMDEKTKNKIIKIGDAFQEAINIAADSLIAYHNSQISEQDLGTKINNYQSVFNEFLEAVTPYIVKEGK